MSVFDAVAVAPPCRNVIVEVDPIGHGDENVPILTVSVDEADGGRDPNDNAASSRLPASTWRTTLAIRSAEPRVNAIRSLRSFLPLGFGGISPP
jgi:hypothetical protein